MMFNPKWTGRFLDLAEFIAGWSRDPSTKVGAVIVRPDKTIASVGYNGFPRGVDDTHQRYADRETKYGLVVHAEANAIVAASESLEGCTIFTWPFPPCSDCAGLIVQSGIDLVVAPEPNDEQVVRWGKSFELADTIFREGDVKLALIPGTPRLKP